MSGTTLGVLLVCACAVIEGFSQVALKISADVPQRRVLWITVGVILVLVSAVIYSGALRLLNVSVAYAIDALGFVSVAILSKWFLNEKVTAIRWTGVALIMIGTGLIVAHA